MFAPDTCRAVNPSSCSKEKDPRPSGRTNNMRSLPIQCTRQVPCAYRATNTKHTQHTHNHTYTRKNKQTHPRACTHACVTGNGVRNVSCMLRPVRRLLICSVPVDAHAKARQTSKRNKTKILLAQRRCDRGWNWAASRAGRRWSRKRPLQSRRGPWARPLGQKQLPCLLQFTAELNVLVNQPLLFNSHLCHPCILEHRAGLHRVDFPCLLLQQCVTTLNGRMQSRQLFVTSLNALVQSVQLLHCRTEVVGQHC